jgi:hypothetical protein
MSKYKAELILGLILLILPVSGLPNIFRVTAMTAVGAILVYMSMISFKEQYRKTKRAKHPNHHFEIFVESKPSESLNETNIIDNNAV